MAKQLIAKYAGRVGAYFAVAVLTACCACVYSTEADDSTDSTPQSNIAPPPSPNPLGSITGAPVSGNRRPPLLPTAPYMVQSGGYPANYQPGYAAPQGYGYQPYGYGVPPQLPQYQAPAPSPPYGNQQQSNFGAGPQQGGYSPAPTGQPYNEQGYPPQPGYGQQQGAPTQGYPPPQGYQPAQGYYPQSQGSQVFGAGRVPALQAPPPQGYSPQQGYSPSQGYPQPQGSQTYGAGRVPALQAPPSQGYPQQQGYPPPAGYGPGNGFPAENQIPEFGKPLPMVPSRPLPRQMEGTQPYGQGWSTNGSNVAGPQVSPDEVRVTKLEQAAFGSTYPEHEVEDRLDHLEKEVFGEKSTAAVTDRLSKLESKLAGDGTFGQNKAGHGRS